MAWMTSSRLRLNYNKTELIWLCAARYVKLYPAGPLLIVGAVITPRLKIRDLGVMVDSDLLLKAHVQHVTAVCYFHIWQLRLLRRSLTFGAAHSLVRALQGRRQALLTTHCADSQSSRLLQWHPGQCTAWSSQ